MRTAFVAVAMRTGRCFGSRAEPSQSGGGDRQEQVFHRSMECTGFDDVRGALFEDPKIFFSRTSNTRAEEDCNIGGKRLRWHKPEESI